MKVRKVLGTVLFWMFGSVFAVAALCLVLVVVAGFWGEARICFDAARFRFPSWEASSSLYFLGISYWDWSPILLGLATMAAPTALFTGIIAALGRWLRNS